MRGVKGGKGRTIAVLGREGGGLLSPCTLPREQGWPSQLLTPSPSLHSSPPYRRAVGVSEADLSSVRMRAQLLASLLEYCRCVKWISCKP